MSRIRIYLLTALIIVSGIALSQESANESAKKLKVISYNIWNGFEWGKDSIRKENVVDWIDKQKPDVVALQELCGFTQEKLSDLAKEWGHSYSEILKTEGYPVGITSNKPIQVKERILENMHHGALHCKTHGVDFFVIHFSPFSYKKRHQEAGIILSKLSEVKKKQNKYMVLGDFNALSPFDAHLYHGNENLLSSKRESEKEHKHVRNLWNGELEFGVVAKFIGFPLIDVTQKYTQNRDDRVSCPTQVFEQEKGEGRPSRSTRIDYIFVSPELGKICTSASVCNSEENWYLSDHYPVVAEF